MIYVLWVAELVIVITYLMIMILLCQAIFRDIVGMITKGYAPFVAIPQHAIRLLEESISIPEKECTIYDLGCGDGRVLCALANKFPHVQYIGIEYSWMPYLFAKISARAYKNITIKYKNFFKEDLSDADGIITYLFPRLMDSLLPKLEKELKPGAMLYSFDFPFTNKEPRAIIDNKKGAATRGNRLWIYGF